MCIISLLFLYIKWIGSFQVTGTIAIIMNASLGNWQLIWGVVHKYVMPDTALLLVHLLRQTFFFLTGHHFDCSWIPVTLGGTNCRLQDPGWKRALSRNGRTFICNIFMSVLLDNGNDLQEGKGRASLVKRFRKLPWYSSLVSPQTLKKKSERVADHYIP